MDTKAYKTKRHLKDAFARRVISDTKAGFPPIMTEKEHEKIWFDNYDKLCQRTLGDNGYMMMRVDQDAPLSVDNYRLVKRKDYLFNIFGLGFEQNSVRAKIACKLKKPKTQAHRDSLSMALSAYKKQPCHIEKAGKKSGEARRGKKRGPYRKGAANGIL